MLWKTYWFSMFAGALSLIISSTTVAQDVHARINAGPPALRAEHVFDAKVTIADLLNIGKSKYRERRLIPITGGTFKGVNIEGVVVPGGADWQLTRPDGDTELNARYTLRTSDGILIQVINRVLLHAPKINEGMTGSYARSVLDFEAPVDSPYDWLNHSIFLGTLTIPQPMPKGYTLCDYRCLSTALKQSMRTAHPKEANFQWLSLPNAPFSPAERRCFFPRQQV